MSADWQILEPVTARQFEEYFDLRWHVLRAPWNQPRGSERDEFETAAQHCIALDAGGKVIGTARLHIVGDGVGQIRYMAVDPSHRGRGIGSEMLRFLESRAIRGGIRRLKIDAREPARPFYERMGYSARGRGHRLFGVIEHTAMEKNLSPRP